VRRTVSRVSMVPPSAPPHGCTPPLSHGPPATPSCGPQPQLFTSLHSSKSIFGNLSGEVFFIYVNQLSWTNRHGNKKFRYCNWK
jgi:hypothetical protein